MHRETNYQEVFQYANASMVIHDGVTGEILEANIGASELYGYDHATLLSLSVGQLALGDERFNQARALELIHQAQSSGKLLPFEWIVRRSDGRVVPVEGNLKRIGDSHPPRVLVMARDITERKAAEARLRERRRYYSHLIGMSSDGIALIDKRAVLQYISPSVKSILGFPSRVALGHHVFNYIADDDARRMARILAKARRGELKTGTVQYRIRHADGSWRHHEAVFKSFLQEPRRGYVLLNFRDITNRIDQEEQTRERERQLNHFSRLSITGEIAAAVAHEVNQPLCAAMNFFAGCRRRIDSGQGSMEDLRHGLDMAQGELERAARVISSVRNFTSKKPLQRKAVALKALIGSTMDFIHMRASQDAMSPVFDLQADVWVDCDTTLIQQVLTNLVTNAIEAMHGTPEHLRLLLITSKRMEGGMVEVSVTDTGSGFPFSSLDKLPGSFFTTKVHGMGLGLSLCKPIIEAHEGELTFTQLSNPSRTQFAFTLPVITQGDALF